MTGEQRFLRAIGRRIRQLRTAKGWSQEDFANRCGLHRTYISTMEQGRRNLAALNLRAVARAFKITLSDFFAGIE